jgi:hypothetical protein
MTAISLRRRFAGGSLLLSAPVNAVGLAALIAMYVAFAVGERSTGLTLGRTNDILAIVGTALMMPAVIEIHALTGPGRPVLRRTLAVVGLGAMVAIIWLQYLLVIERLPFGTQIQYVMVAYLGVAIWFIVGGWTASTSGLMRDGGRLGAAAALYAGQPWWAWRWGRRLMDLAAGPLTAPAPTSTTDRGSLRPTGGG